MSAPSSRPPRRPPGRKAERAATLTRAEIDLVRSLVIYEDAAVLALNKPAGLSSQGGRGQGNTLDELLYAFVKGARTRPRLIHRLDRDTSGVILAAKTRAGAAALGKALMERRVGKTYLALLAAPPDPPSGSVDVALRREEIGRDVYMRVCASDHPDAQASLSRYRTLATTAEGALVELSPQSGRMHQLRVHMAHLGRPIAGDARYGGALVLGGLAAPRLMLHAAALEFPHPDGGRERLEAPPPEDFAILARRLGLVVEDAADTQGLGPCAIGQR